MHRLYSNNANYYCKCKPLYFYKKAFTIGKNINSFIKFLMNNVLNDEEKKKVRLKTNYMYYQNKTSEDKYCIYYNSHKMTTYPPVIKCTNLDVNKTYSYSHYYISNICK